MKATQCKLAVIVAMMFTLSGTGQETPVNPAGPNSVEPAEKKTSKWQVQVGGVYQWSRGMSVRGPAPVPSRGGRPALSGATALTYPDNRAHIPRAFDDGYVRPDLWTGDGGVPAERQGMTWNWGAQNASQYDYDGGNHPTLSYHINRGEFAGPAYHINRGGSDDDFDAYGVEVKAKHLLRTWTRDGGPAEEPDPVVAMEMSLLVGLAWFPSTKQRHRRSMGLDVYGLSETYTYLDYYGTEAGGSWPALEVPYAGSYGAVGGSDAGPLIPVTPESAALNSAYIGSRRSTVDIESKIWRLRGAAGLEFATPVTDRLRLYVAPQIVLEFVDMNVDRTETTSGVGAGSSRSDSKHKMAVYPGILFTAGADYRISENWYAGTSVGYEWLFYDPSVNVGPDKVTYDLNGGEVSLYVGRRF
jgi:hypothetical protein